MKAVVRPTKPQGLNGLDWQPVSSRLLAIKHPSKISRRPCPSGRAGFPRLIPRVRNHCSWNIRIFSRFPASRRVSNVPWPQSLGSGPGSPDTPGMRARARVRAGRSHDDLLTDFAPCRETRYGREVARGRSRNRASGCSGCLLKWIGERSRTRREGSRPWKARPAQAPPKALPRTGRVRPEQRSYRRKGAQPWPTTQVNLGRR